MKEDILKILNDNSYKVDVLGTNEESIRATDGERIIDTKDIETITDELIKLCSLHNAVEIQCDHNWHHLDNHSDRMECTKCDKQI
jgi:hypothetical protein